uniref:Uncharacterized protein n=1 Tax=Pyxicephalus adspersus TaxID=30357 RepID=A0AAV2ZFW4_PYXAD|nr:TPA: hypothetical protein GDO54_004779 [Pyxicephalus adspersus]
MDSPTGFTQWLSSQVRANSAPDSLEGQFFSLRQGPAWLLIHVAGYLASHKRVNWSLTDTNWPAQLLIQKQTWPLLNSVWLLTERAIKTYDGLLPLLTQVKAH